MYDVIVVGAGLAGLACAGRLEREGIETLVVEASDGIGGRVRTDVLDGFQLDRGFQVLLTGYPEAARVLDYDALDLRELYPGAVVHVDHRFRRVADPFRRPLDALRALPEPIGSWRDYRALARLRARARAGTLEAMLSRRETTAIEALRAGELSPRLIERFFRPFLGGVFLDPGLETSSRMLEFVLRMFSLGHAAVPAAGMGALSAQLGSRLSAGCVRLGARVARVEGGGVVLADGERLESRAIVVATEGPEAARLLPSLTAPGSRSVSCLYFSAERDPVDRGPVLVLNGERAGGPVNNLCVLSSVAPSYAPAGSALVSVTVLGDRETGGLEREVRRQLAGWFGAEVEQWRLLRTYLIEHALPALTPPCLEPRDRTVRLGPGLYVCGDHRETASINGALASGRRAAQSVVEEFARG